MSRRALFLLVSLVVLFALVSGCKKPTPTPTPAAKAPATEPQPTDTATPVPATSTPEPTATEMAMEKEPTPEETAGLPEGPELLEPPDGTEGSVIDLMWDWNQELGANQWFELQIWPDDPDAEPEAYDWYKKMQERITSADLAPGRYLWRVLVVEGREDERGEAMELDYAEPWLFILVRPSLKRGEAGMTPIPTDTPTPSITPTYRPVWPSATPDTRPTATDTTVPPSPTATTEPYEPPTREPTATTEPYEPPAPTATGTTEPYEPPGPTATNTTEPYEPPPTDTPAPAPTATSEPYEPPEPTPEPTEDDPYL